MFKLNPPTDIIDVIVHELLRVFNSSSIPAIEYLWPQSFQSIPPPALVPLLGRGPTKRSFGLVDELTAPLDRWRGTGMVHPWLGVGSAEPSLSSEMSNSAVISTPNINALTAFWTQYSPCHSRVTCTMIIHGEVEWFPGIEFGVWALCLG